MAKTVEVRFIFDTGKAKANVDKLNQGLEQTKEKTKKLKSGLANFKKHWLGVTAAIGGTVLALRSTVKAAAKQEEAERLLAAAMKNAGTYTKERYEHLKKYASQLQKVTTFGDEEIMVVQRMLVQYGLEEKILDEVTEATLDLAVAKKMDLRTAADLVGKTIGSTTNALSRYGVATVTAKDRTERAKQTIEGLARLFGGQARAQAQTFAGQVAQMAGLISDVKEKIGFALMPVLLKIVKAIKDVAEWFNNLNPSIRKTIITIGLIGTAILVLTKVVMAFGVSFQAAFLPVTAAIVGTIAVIAGIKIVLKVIKKHFGSFGNFVRYIWESIKKHTKIVWIAMQIGILYAIKVIIKGVKKMLNVVIGGINLIIKGINLFKKQKIPLLENPMTKVVAGINRAIQKQKEELELAKVIKVEREAMKDEEAQRDIERENEKNAALIASNASKNEAIKQKEKETANKIKQEYSNLIPLLMKMDEARAKKFQTWQNFMINAQSSNIRALWGVWKSLAIIQTISDTYRAATAAYAAMAGIPIVGPALGVAAAAAAIAFGMEQVHKIAAQPPPKTAKAEKGGIIPGSREGTLLVAGEKNKAEAIIPLENQRGESMLPLGYTININVENLYGDEASINEFVKKIDEKLYDLFRNKESVFAGAITE